MPSLQFPFPALCEKTHPNIIVGKCPWCGLPISDGHIGETSFEYIRGRIASLIAEEDHAHPLTDQMIVEMLVKQERVTLSQRTVSKIRKSMGIPPADDRRTT